MGRIGLSAVLALLMVVCVGAGARAQQYPVDGCAFQLQGTTVQELYLASGVSPSTPGASRALDCWTTGQAPSLVPIDDIMPGAGYWCHFHKSPLVTVLVFDTDPDGTGAAPICASVS